MSEIINNSASTLYSFDGSQSQQSASSNVLPINLESSSGLVVTKNAVPNTFLAGDIINYTITITNNSGQYLSGVRIIDNLGNGNLAYVLSSAKLTTLGQTYSVNPISTMPLTFTLQQLNVGQSMTLSYKGQVIFNLPQSVSLITNSVKAIGYTSTGTITSFANNTIQKKTDVDFSITKTSNITDAKPNETFNYYLKLTNNTSTNASINSITDNLPSNYNLVSVNLKIGTSSPTMLMPSDYSISPSNVLTIPSMTGPEITVSANNSTIITLTGFFN